MSNGWSLGCKIVAWIALIGGIITGSILAIAYGSWWMILAVWPGAVAAFLLFGAVSYAVEKVDEILSELHPEDEEDEEEDEGERQANLKAQYESGILTEEEYQKAIFEEPEEEEKGWSGTLRK